MLITYMANAFTLISGFGSMYIITNYTSVEVYGILAIIAATSGILTNLVSARTSEAIVRFVKEEMIKGNKENIKLILFIGFFIDIFIGLIILGLFYLLANFIATTFIKDASYTYEVWIYSFITFFTYIKGVPYGLMQTKEKFMIINSFTIVENFLKIVLLVFIVFYLKEIKLIDIIYVQILVSIVSFIMFLSYFIKIYKKEYLEIPLRKDTELIKRYWSFNIKTFTSSFLKAGNQKLDTLILGYFIDPKTVGIYEIIKKIVATPLGFLASPFNLLYYSKLVELYTNKKYDEFKGLIYNITLKITLISIVYLAFLLMLSSYLIDIFDLLLKVDILRLYIILLAPYAIPYFWWGRVFSNAVDPMYSIYTNALYMFLYFTLVIMLTYQFELIGLLIGIGLSKIITSNYLFKKLKYIKG